jgi:hypothetical protein
VVAEPLACLVAGEPEPASRRTGAVRAQTSIGFFLGPERVRAAAALDALAPAICEVRRRAVRGALR